MPSCANRVVKAMWQSNTSILPLRRYQKSAVGKSILAPVGRDRPAKTALDRQLDADHVAAHGDLLQLPVNVGKELGQEGDQIAQLRAPQARLPLFISNAVEHAVLCEQVPEPLGVQRITLAIVVRAQDNREVALLTLGQVAVGERQLGQVVHAQARADLRALGGSRSLRRRSAAS